jgi:hypothetical protein
MRAMQAVIAESQIIERLRGRLAAMLDGRHAERVAISPFPISHPDGGRTWHGARRADRPKT